MKRSVAAVVVLCTLIALWLGMAPPAPAQPILERLERRIRQRLDQTSRRADPADAQTGEKPNQAAAEKPAEKPAENATAKADKEPGYLGILVDDRNDRGRGVRVLDVRPGGPAEKAGFRKQDLITGAAGIRVRQMADMADVLEFFSAGESLAFDVLRGQERLTVKATLARRPPAAAEPAKQPPAKAVPAVEKASAQIPAEVAAEVPPAEGDAAGPAQPPPAGPQLQPPEPPNSPADIPSEMERLRRRVAELERRVAELERALAKALKKP